MAGGMVCFEVDKIVRTLLAQRDPDAVPGLAERVSATVAAELAKVFPEIVGRAVAQVGEDTDSSGDSSGDKDAEGISASATSPNENRENGVSESREPALPTANFDPDPALPSGHLVQDHLSATSGGTGVEGVSGHENLARLADTAFPWLPDVNPYRDKPVAGDGDGPEDAKGAELNCVLAAIAVEWTLESGDLHRVGPWGGQTAQWLHDFAGPDAVRYVLPGLDKVEEVMNKAPVGARGILMTWRQAEGPDVRQPDHAFNVVRHQKGVMFLDGQAGRAASGRDLRHLAGRVEFIPITSGIPEPGSEYLAGTADGGSRLVGMGGIFPSWRMSGFHGGLAGISFTDPRAIEFDPGIFADGYGLLTTSWADDTLIVMNVGQSDVNAAIRDNSFTSQTPPWDPYSFFVIADGSGIDAAGLARGVAESREFRQHVRDLRPGTDPVIVLLASRGLNSAGDFGEALKSRGVRSTVYAYSGSVRALVVIDRGNLVPVAVVPSDGGRWGKFFSGETGPGGAVRRPRLISNAPWDVAEIHAPGYEKVRIENGEAVRAPGEPMRLIGVHTSESYPLLDAGGRLIGLTLGASKEPRIAIPWARNGGLSKHYTFPFHDGDTFKSQAYPSQGATNNQEISIDNPLRQMIGDRPFSIVAHKTAVARVNGISRVDGAGMALALMCTEEFRKVHRSQATSPTSYVLVACSMASDDQIKRFQQTLSNYGFSAPVVAATGVVEIKADGRTGIAQGHGWISVPNAVGRRAVDARPARRAPEPPVTVQFRQQVRELDEAILSPVRARLEALARWLVDVGTESRSADAPVPRTEITGFSNGPRVQLLSRVNRSAGNSGLRRARAVRDHLKELVIEDIQRRSVAWRLAAGLDSDALVVALAEQLVPADTVRGRQRGSEEGPEAGRRAIVSVANVQAHTVDTSGGMAASGASFLELSVSVAGAIRSVRVPLEGGTAAAPDAKVLADRISKESRRLHGGTNPVDSAIVSVTMPDDLATETRSLVVAATSAAAETLNHTVQLHLHTLTEPIKLCPP